MTRQEVLSAYRVNDRGVIVSPGRFEGEMIYVPHFAEVWLDGGGEDGWGPVDYFDVLSEDKAEFPELGEQRKVCLAETEDGFVVQLECKR